MLQEETTNTSCSAPTIAAPRGEYLSTFKMKNTSHLTGIREEFMTQSAQTELQIDSIQLLKLRTKTSHSLATLRSNLLQARLHLKMQKETTRLLSQSAQAP